MRRTKIVCTIGPACESKDMLQKLFQAGMDVARLNFSHGSHEEHGKRILLLKEISRQTSKPLAILLDTKGPEIRTLMVPEEGVVLTPGASFTLDTSEETGSPKRVGITYADLWKEVSSGTHLLLDDGLIDLEVRAVGEGVIHTVVCNEGLLKSRKGINVPGVSIQLPAVTEKDISDIQFGLTQGIDFIAASFTRKAADILAVRRIVEEAGGSVSIIAKIESREGIDNLEEILDVADGLMVARGDLGVEIPVEEVPLYQKTMIEKCNALGKPVIVATQMLDSMIRQPRPTRAEASDVANAILDGTDAIMLSGETASGHYPYEAVQMMAKIALRTETLIREKRAKRHPQLNVVEAISYASYTVAEDLDAQGILTPTHSGSTPRMISKYRPKALIIAATPFPATARRLCLTWGVHPIITEECSGTDELMSGAVRTALKEGLIKTGDTVVITAGVPVGQIGTTNMIKVQIVGNLLTKGTGIGRKAYSGTARKIDQMDDAQFENGDILVTRQTDASFVPLLEKAGALVIEEGGLTSHAAISALHYGIPAIVGVNKISAISDGRTITVDAASGAVYDGTVSIL